MTLEEFWTIVELSWQDSPELNQKRLIAMKTNDPDLLEELSKALEGAILDNYTNRLNQLSKEELTGFIHMLEERLYHIDREAIQEITDGSDDGFLYCHCFIFGMGKAYYDMIDKDPSTATMDLESEIFGFTAYGVYDEKFDEEFERYTVHSIETCSNIDAWRFE